MFAWRGNYTNSLGGDPYWNGVVFAQNFEYPSSGVATGPIDISTNGFATTLVNGAVANNLSSFSSGNQGSVLFNGSSAYATLPSNSAFTLGSGDWTIEYWTYLTTTSVTQCFLDMRYPGSFSVTAVVIDFTSNQLRFYTNGGSAIVATSGLLTTNTWYHVALSKSGSSTKLFVNGTQTGSTYSDTNSYVATTLPNIGRFNDGTGAYLSGYISNLRIVKGVAVYTSNFTAPTSPLTATQSANVNGSPSAAISGTQTSYLMSVTQGSGIGQANNSNYTGSDLSTNAFTPTGSATFSGLSPFTNTYPGSFNFSSALTQTLVVATNAVFTYASGDFTMECWVRFVTIGTQQFIIDQRNSGTATAIIPTIYLDATNVIVYYVNGAARITGTAVIVANTWYHVAVARSSTSTILFVNGIQDGSTYSDSNNYAASRVVVGTNAASAANYLNGYATNIRLVKGTAVYTANFTPSAIPLTAISGTSLLLVNVAGFQDISPQGQLISTGGTTPFVTTALYKYGTQSSYYVASAQQTVLNQTYLPFGTNDFTIECWVYRSTAGVLHSLFGKGTGSAGWALQINASNQLIWVSGSTTLRTSTTTIGATTWTNVAVTRSGSTCYMFVGGTLQGASFADATNYNQLNNLYVGTDRSSLNGLSGYLDDIRITNGVCRYTATYTPMTSTFPIYGGGNFPTPSTPPTYPAFVTTGVALYVDSGNATSYSGSGTTWTDLSGNGWNGTLSNTTYVSAGSSSYFSFNGSSSRVDFGNATPANFGTSDFTVTFWMYASVWNGSGMGPLSKRNSDSSTGWHMYSDGGISTLVNGRFGSGTTNNQCTTAVVLNTWTMYTVIRSGSGTNNLKWYVNGSSTPAGQYTNTNNITSTLTLYAGYNQQYGPYLTGRMSVIAIYNRALTTTENTQNYDATSYRY